MAAHLSQEIDATADDEGRDGRADDGEERDGADVLEEVTLKRTRAHGRAEGEFLGLVGVLCNALFICKVGHSTGTQEHISLVLCFQLSAHCLNWSQYSTFAGSQDKCHPYKTQAERY